MRRVCAERIRKLEEKCEKLKWRENAGTGAVRRDPPGNADGDVEAATRIISDGWLTARQSFPKKRKKAQLLEQMQKLKDESVAAWGRQEERSAGGTGCEERIRIQGAGSNLGEQRKKSNV